MDISTILPSLLENFQKIVPARVIMNYQRGLLYLFGCRLIDIPPGYPIVWIPLLMSCHIEDCASQPMETALQTIETKDGQTISLTVAINYNIYSLFNYVSILNADMSIENAIQGSVTEACRALTWKEIHEGGQILDIILESLNKKVSEWGVEIENVELINCARTRAIRLIHN